jgi:hypothetical protein
VGNDITQAVLKAINDKVIPDGWNEIMIVLIPKVDNPEEVSQFQPISLRNMVYKIISKMLALRLKVILLEIILQPKVLLFREDLSLITFLLPMSVFTK